MQATGFSFIFPCDGQNAKRKKYKKNELSRKGKKK